jgi:TetR/AcrR family transcriptional repressor of mexAB-oprM operon
MRRTKEDAEKTRCAILAAAEELFLQNGVAHTSLEQIARHAGVTRGAVYWHFENKADLFHAMLSQVRLPPEQLTQRLVVDPDAEPLRPLRDLCVESVRSLDQEQKRRIFTILLHRCEMTEELRPARERHHALIIQFIALCEQQFHEAARRDQLRDGIQPRQAAHALHALLVGLFTDLTRDPPSFDLALDPAVLIDALFRGLTRDWACADA